ncbi:hypothetical protein ABIC65_001474 [Sphingomonas trueperi]|uniref:hypothetical protein n=1 Tax=Sphingomonas trueperi TaxID=53317 RepID=UPI00339385B5
MPIRHSIWKVGKRPAALREAALPSEALLEDMIVAEPAMLSDQWMIIGRQVNTGFGGRIDLLALAPDASLVLIELKRGKTPREVVAQAIDYASWAEDLDGDEISRIYTQFSGGGNLTEAFRARFGQPLDEDVLNESHQIVIVASHLDPSSERIVDYLNKRDIPINVLCFQVFEADGGQLLSRSWLLDPVETQVAASVSSGGTKSADREPWNGEYYVNFGEGESRSWEDARRYGFVSAGGGSWYSGTLNLLHEGDRIWVRVPKRGYVGVGRVTGAPVAAGDFRIADSAGVTRPVLDALTGRSYHRAFVDDQERTEYFVPVEWLRTVPLSDAVDEVGMFGNQNTVCAPKKAKWRHTIERLKAIFPEWDHRT